MAPKPVVTIVIDTAVKSASTTSEVTASAVDGIAASRRTPTPALPPIPWTSPIPSASLAVTSLVVLALFTAVSMTMVTTGFGATLASRQGALAAAAPAFGVASLAFGCWYAAAAWSLMPYPF